MSAHRKKYDKRPSSKIKSFIKDTLRRITRQIRQEKNINSSNSMPYSTEEFKVHIESKFEIMMTWNNYGSLWHIDHIYPISKIIKENEDKTQKEILFICNKLSNLQPLWAIDNLKKGAR